MENSSILNVQGGGNAAVRIFGAKPTLIRSNTIQATGGGAFGVYLSGSGTYRDPVIDWNDISSSGSETVYATGSNQYIFLHANDVVQSVSTSPALFATNSGNIYTWPGAVYPYTGLNRIKGGRIYATSSGKVDAGFASGTRNSNHFCSSATTLEVNTSGVIYAKYDYWYNNADPALINNGGTIYYSNKLGAASCTGLEAVAKFSGDGISTDDARIIDAKLLMEQGRYADAEELLFEVLDSPDGRTVSAALAELRDLYVLSRRISVKDRLEGVLSGTVPYSTRFLSALAAMYGADSNASAAIALYDEMLQSSEDNETLLDAGMNKFYLLLEMGAFDAAEAALNTVERRVGLEASTSDFAPAWVALATERQAGSEPRVDETPPTEESVAKSVESVAGKSPTLSVYPNPFNPVTTFRYRVDSPGNAEITLFDALGRRVATVADQYTETGVNDVSFDASHLPSGSYYYRFTLDGRVVDSGSVLLMK